MTPIRAASLVFVLVSTIALSQQQQQLPQLTATTLNGREIRVPAADANVAVYILSLGFSRDSGKTMKAWDDLIAPRYAASNADPRVRYYELPVIEAAPGFVRGMIVKGMRKDIPESGHSRFAPLVKEEKRLKQLANFREENATYLIVAAKDGRVVWTSSGAAASTAALAELQKAVAGLLK